MARTTVPSGVYAHVLAEPAEGDRGGGQLGRVHELGVVAAVLRLRAIAPHRLLRAHIDVVDRPAAPGPPTASWSPRYRTVV